MDTQAGWRWCSSCQGMVCGSAGDGVCFDEQPHYLHDSAEYLVPIDSVGEGMQDGWRCCSRCLGLVYSGFDNGTCFDGTPHALDDSAAYALYHGVTPDGTQEGWCWCRRCQALVYSGFSDGFCWDGEHHYLSDSGPYSVEMVPSQAPTSGEDGALPPVAPAPLNPTIVVTEQGRHISVDGQGFTPNGPVFVAFVRGSRVKKVPLVADGAGVIWYQENDTVGSSGATVVIGRDATTDRSGFGQALRLTPRATSDPVTIDSGTNLEPT